MLRAYSIHNPGGMPMFRSSVKSRTMLSIHCRPMQPHDYWEVAEIDSKCFESPWSDSAIKSLLRKGEHDAIVGMLAGRVVAYEFHRITRDSLELLRFAVDPRFRRATVGTQMVKRLVQKAGMLNKTAVRLCVRETNLPGQLFWRSQGFKAICVWRGHYKDTWEDAYRMVYGDLS